MTDDASSVIRQATAADLADVRRLFRDYAAWLAIDLSFQGFEQELAGLPGKYAPPTGALLLARSPSDEVIGCVGVRPFASPNVCELKRLFVTPAGRGQKLGRALVAAAVRSAEQAGYRTMLLDTLPAMEAARAIYTEAGFRTVAPYYETPLPGTVFMAKALDQNS